MKLHLPVCCILAVFFCARIRSATAGCPCPNEENCQHPRTDLGMKDEIMVFSNGETDVQVWKWDTITTLIVPSSFNISNKKEANTMCITHSKGRKFGITVDMTLSGKLNESSDEAKEWVKFVTSQQREWHAEVITVNLLPYMKNDHDSSSEDHLALVRILKNVKDEIDEVTSIRFQLACIVPWKPPCAELNATCDFALHSKEMCDFFIINPDSFMDVQDQKCIARATIPLSSLVFGISEYNSHHVGNNRIILGIPWHGYDHTCTIVQDNICMLNEVNPDNSTSIKCDFNRRKRITNGDLVTKYPEQYAKHALSELYSAPYIFYSKGSEYHQVWFEDHYSLASKYRLVHELDLKGIAIMYGDDLTAKDKSKNLVNDGIMWSWVGHEFVLSSSKKPINEDLHYADTVAGVAIGCLILGIIMGILFTCIALRSQVKKPKQPFLRDADTGVDEFTDEDPTL